MASIFGTANLINGYQSLTILNKINSVLCGMTYAEQAENSDMVRELIEEREQVEIWRDAFISCFEDGEDYSDSATILDYMA